MSGAAQLCVGYFTTYPAVLVARARAEQMTLKQIAELLIESAPGGSTLANCSALVRSDGKLTLRVRNVACDGSHAAYSADASGRLAEFETSVASVRAAQPLIDVKRDAQLGACKMFVFVAPATMRDSAREFDTHDDLVLCAALGLAPWFRVQRGAPPLELGVTHNEPEHTRDVRSLSGSYPILPTLHTPPPAQAAWLADGDCEAVYAFALAWHAHSQTAAAPARRVPREMLLRRVSDRFFVRSAAGLALFSSALGAHRMIRAVARLRTERAHAFLAHTLADALDEWCTVCESRCDPELAMIDLVRGSLAPTCAALARAAQRERVGTSPADADVQLCTAYECTESGRLTRAEARYLAEAAGAARDGDGDCDDAALRATLVLTYHFGTGLKFVDDALLGDGGAGVLLGTHSIMSAGVRYVPAVGVARGMLRRLMRWLLLAHAGSAAPEPGSDGDEVDDDIDELEAQLLNAMPDTSDPSAFGDDRCTRFDDRWSSVVPATVPLERYDMAADLALQRSTRVLERRRCAAGRRAQPLSLAASLGVLHTDACHSRTPGDGGHIRAGSYASAETGEQLRRQLLGRERELALDDLYQTMAADVRQRSAAPASGSTGPPPPPPPPPSLSETGVAVAAPVAKEAAPVHSDALHASTLGDIEDLVGNAHDNRALPACMERFAQKLLDDKQHLKNAERQLYYRLLRSTALPELSHERAVRHMLRATTDADKLAEQWGDVALNFEAMADKSHRLAASGYQRTLRQHGGDCTDEDALARTTCAPKCKTMQRARGAGAGDQPGCPFAWRDRSAVRALLVRAGVDGMRAQAIAQRAPSDASEACRLHAMAAHTPSPLTPAPEPLRRYAARGFAHPYEFVHCAAQMVAERRSAQQ